MGTYDVRNRIVSKNALILCVCVWRGIIKHFTCVILGDHKDISIYIYSTIAILPSAVYCSIIMVSSALTLPELMASMALLSSVASLRLTTCTSCGSCPGPPCIIIWCMPGETVIVSS